MKCECNKERFSKEVKAVIIECECQMDHKIFADADLVVTTDGKILKNRYGKTCKCMGTEKTDDGPMVVGKEGSKMRYCS